MPASSKPARRKKNATRRVPVTVLDTAKVTLKVIEFRDVLAPDPLAKIDKHSKKSALPWDRCTPHKMSMPKKHPQVKIDPKKPDTLLIKPKGATILFTITPDDYYPVGITFIMGKGEPTASDQKRLGFLNFDQRQYRANELRHSLQITDCYKDRRHDDRYKFSVIIQRVKDGAIGIIDPDIVHGSSHP
jgi:hypothetical protein